MNSFYLATAKITCPIDSFFTGCWKCWEYSFPDWIFLSPTLFEQFFAIFYQRNPKVNCWSYIDFYGWINVHQSTYLRIICIAFILSKWHKILCWFSAEVREKPALMFALGHMKDIGMFYSALPRSIIPWLGGIQDEDKKWAEPRFLPTTLHVLGP